jgi:polyhydroxybutyrate depolymerase
MAMRRRGDFVLVLPDGTRDSNGRRFWNATDACCNFDDVDVDDVGYLRGLIAEAAAGWPIDTGRVYLLGHSNGGYMAHRMGCDASDVVTAILSFAGSQWADASRCTPSTPLSVLQLHGTADESTLYAGGMSRTTTYPGAEETVAMWADLLHCAEATEQGAALNLEQSLEGAETDVLTWRGCDEGNEVLLWRMQGGGHVPLFERDAIDQMLDWLLAHDRTP